MSPPCGLADVLAFDAWSLRYDDSAANLHYHQLFISSAMARSWDKITAQPSRLDAMLDPQARRNRKTPGHAALRASTGCRSPASGAAAAAAAAKSSEAAPSWRLGLLLHFFVHLALVADAEPPLARRGFGRTHHRILYFAHFAPGLTV